MFSPKPLSLHWPARPTTKLFPNHQPTNTTQYFHLHITTELPPTQHKHSPIIYYPSVGNNPYHNTTTANLHHTTEHMHPLNTTIISYIRTNELRNTLFMPHTQLSVPQSISTSHDRHNYSYIITLLAWLPLTYDI